MLNLLLILLLFFTSHLEGNKIENALFPLMDYFEQIANIQPSKYSKDQFSEIDQILKFKSQRIRILSYNLLSDVNDNELNEIDRWPMRSQRVAHIIKLIKPDIICTQELQKNQIDDLSMLLGDEFIFYGKPIKNNNFKDVDGIFYLSKRFKLLKGESHLMGFDCPHALNLCEFQDLYTDKMFLVFNTHFPYLSTEDRVASARFIIDKVQQTHLPVILAGDFNTIPHRLDLKDLPCYDGDFIKKILLNGGLVNSIECSLLGHLGPISSFTNDPNSNNAIPFAGTGIPGIILDHIFVSKNIKILFHTIDSARIEGRFPSDHLPVIVDLLVNP